MKFCLSKSDFEILKKFECAFYYVKDIKETKDDVYFNIDDTDMEDFQLDMVGDIIHIGMDNQDTVNALGKEMYRIHDCLMYSENGSRYRPL